MIAAGASENLFQERMEHTHDFGCRTIQVVKHFISLYFRFFTTTMPAGAYCDQYNGSLQGGKCTGQTITVKADGQQFFLLLRRKFHWNELNESAPLFLGTAYLEIGSQQAVAFSIASRIGKFLSQTCMFLLGIEVHLENFRWPSTSCRWTRRILEDCDSAKERHTARPESLYPWWNKPC